MHSPGVVAEGEDRIVAERCTTYPAASHTPGIVELANDRCDQENVIGQLKSGINALHVPRSTLTKIQGRSVPLLERFDRLEGKRVPYISAMTLLEAHDGDAHDYAEIAEALSDVGAVTTEDLRELWRRIAFSALINNTDDHLRNHGFLREPGGWRLSPAFDINPNPDPGTSRQTGIGGAYDWAGALDALITYAKEFRLTPKAAGETLDKISSWVAGGARPHQPQLSSPMWSRSELGAVRRRLGTRVGPTAQGSVSRQQLGDTNANPVGLFILMDVDAEVVEDLRASPPRGLRYGCGHV